MSAVQDQFASIARQGQDLIGGPLRAWAAFVPRLSGLSSTKPGSVPDISAAVDSAFDFAEQILATQREVIKGVLQAVTSPAGALGSRRG